MRLSQIKLAGFKSFVDPTHLHLPGQIVGVVGPNGCGKSNVIDALRWVLGESKASALRGDSMQDVIFNGSLKRKPVARASVELVFDNSLAKMTGPWADYAEISIGRVLLRNGESSYYINKQKVRRRDITDIFLGTGLGARAYAIVEQGMISRIIEARPEELRVFLEEAAGVSRYRDRRRETAQRLADTRDNLLRVDDILHEMDKQLQHLGVQAEVARQFRELEKQRDLTQQTLWRVKKQEAMASYTGFSEQLTKIRLQIEVQTAALRDTENRLEDCRRDHHQHTDALYARQSELYGANAGIARLEQDIKHATQQKLRLTNQLDNMLKKIEQQQQQGAVAAEQLAHWQIRLEDAAASVLEAEQNTQHIDLPLLEASAQATQAHYNEQKGQHSSFQQQLQLIRTQHDHLQRTINQMESRKQRLQLEQSGLTSPDQQFLQLAEEEAIELEMMHAAQEETLIMLQDNLSSAQHDRLPLRASLQQEEQQTARIGARLHALQQLQLNRDENISSWLARYQLNDTLLLWQCIRIEHGWEIALEAVLREQLNAQLMPEMAIHFDAPPARVAFYVAKAGTDQDADKIARHNAALHPLLDFVVCQDEQVLPAIGEWLASVYTIADLTQALQMRAYLPVGGRLVTKEGHLVSQYSVIFHAPDNHVQGVLVRRQEIEQLEDQHKSRNRAVECLQQALEEAEGRYLLIDEQITCQRNELSELTRREHTLQLAILKLKQQVERSEERRLQLDFELDEVLEQLFGEQAQLLAYVEKMHQLSNELNVSGIKLNEAQRDANAGEANLREQRERVRVQEQARQEANFLQRTCQDKVRDLHAHVQLLANNLIDAQQDLQILQAEEACCIDEKMERDLQDALQQGLAAEQALSLARNNLEGVAARLQTLEQGRLSCEHQLANLREQLASVALKEQEARLNVEQWAEKLQGVDESVPLPDIRASQLPAELNRLNKAMEALGPVNLAALGELQAASERRLYLNAQALDLQQAIVTLEEAIRHIDKESRDLLMTTFNQVNLQLAELFPVLFAGGDARLVLTGEEILDGGIQVMAQPPGKKNSTIHLLSGGEKALTAIALIFSLFQLNPAPFCLLDEVDAPLDDTNTERLCALVRKMARHTQFIFISHNKIAMEMAEQLIGVTMQEQGVSRVVTVDIEAALRMRDEVIA